MKARRSKAAFFVFPLCWLAIASSALAILPPELTEDFFVSDFNHDRVAVYDEVGGFVSDFTADGLNGPRGIVVDPNGSVFVASELSNEILMFDTDGVLEGRFTHSDLARPTGMALHDGELYVSSFAGDEIVVFGADGTYSRSFTGGGLNGPNCVAFDSEGNIYVASAITAEVIKFDQNEEFVTSFTGGGLSSPMGIARDENDVLYVAGGGSSNIVKFDTDGNFLGQIRHPDLSGPQGVAFDDRGHIFSSSFFKDNIVEFNAEGDYVQTITAGGLDIPRSIAFIPTIEDLLGDFDGDGVLDAADIDLLSQAVLTNAINGAFDLTGDGILSAEDRTFWVQQIAETSFGDANLNGTVVFADFLAVSRNFGNEGGWASGDFDGNGEIGFPDFLQLSRNFGQSTAAEAISVPEPTTQPSSLFAVVIAVLSLFRHRHR